MDSQFSWPAESKVCAAPVLSPSQPGSARSRSHASPRGLLHWEAKLRFKVPKYQREYIWRKTHWEDLFDDIWANPTGHFLGSIICINRSDDACVVQELELVDRPQRLTTLSLLYAAIYGQLAKAKDLDEETQHELYNLKFRLLVKGSNRAPKERRATCQSR